MFCVSANIRPQLLIELGSIKRRFLAAGSTILAQERTGPLTIALRSGAALIALAAAGPVPAQAPAMDDLAALVRAQAAEIATLRARLDRLEAGQTASGDAAQAAITPAAPPRTRVARGREANAANVSAEWGAGLPVFRSGDGFYTFKPRGRILTDVSSTFGSRYGGRNITTTGMRALRIGLESGVGPRFFYQFETDFSENQVDVVSAFLGWRDKIGSSLDYDVRGGHLFNDRSFEGSTGSDSTPFLERSVVATAIIPQRGFYGIGIMPRLFWSTGHVSLTVSGDRVDGDQAASDSRTVLARAHWNPIKADGGALHLGLWGFDESLSGTVGTLTRDTAIGGRFNGALRVSTGMLTGGTGITGYGAELGGYLGPVWMMGEVGRRHARLDGGRPDFSSKAWSLSGGWFLSGDLPPYNPRLGSFGQPQVLKPVFDGGIGAIELTARYESLDYGGLATGGRGWAATIGSNWYLNSFTRLQVNLAHWNTHNRADGFPGADDGQTVSTRLAVSF